MPHQVNRSILLVECFHFVWRKTDFSGSCQFFKMYRIGSTGNRCNPRFTREHPYQGKLSRCHPFYIRPLLDKSHKRHIVFQCLRSELWKIPSSVALFEATALINSTGKKCPSKRTIRYESYAQFFKCRKIFRFRFAPPYRILTLNCGNRTYSMGATD